MEKVLEFILNPYCYIFLSAFVIMGLTQLIKFIPCFKNNNWNISFPVLFGYVASFGWAILTQYEIEANLEKILAFGAGIGALSSVLYSIIKKMFDKNYKAEEQLENNEIYKFFNGILSSDIEGFKDKTVLEKFDFIKGIVKDVKRIAENSKVESKDELKKQIDVFVGKFLSTDTLGDAINNLMEIVEKNYKLPLKKEEENKKEEILEKENKGEINNGNN